MCIRDRSNLTDEDYSSLYVFNGGGMSGLSDGAWIEMELDREYPVKSMEAAFEHLSSDKNNFQFTFDVYGKSSTDTEWQQLFAGVNATRLDDGYLQTLTLDTIKNLKSVRIVITKITCTAGDPWPALAEFKILLIQAVPVQRIRKVSPVKNRFIQMPEELYPVSMMVLPPISGPVNVIRLM